ncbi:hypothetical protein ACFL6I_09165 [candidate division KSB1 bacterium]
MKKITIILLLVSLILAQSVYSQGCNPEDADFIIEGKARGVNYESESFNPPLVTISVHEMIKGTKIVNPTIELLSDETGIFEYQEIVRVYLDEHSREVSEVGHTFNRTYYTLKCGVKGKEHIRPPGMPNIPIEYFDEWFVFAEKYGLLDENREYYGTTFFWDYKRSVPKTFLLGKYVPSSGSHESLAKEFIDENKEFIQVDFDNLKFSHMKTPKKETLLQYSQEYKGIPVYAAYVKFIFNTDKSIAMYAMNYHPHIDISTKPQLSERKAVNIAKDAYQRVVSFFATTSSMTIYPEEKEDSYEYHLAYVIDFPMTRYVVDANNGEILLERSLIMDSGFGGSSAGNTGLAVVKKASMNLEYIAGFVVLVIMAVSFIIYRRRKKYKSNPQHLQNE